MAYNLYGFQNPYYPPAMPDTLMRYQQNQMTQPPTMQNPVAQNGVQWVNGEMEARNWMIAPNSAVALWDSAAPIVYLKQADASGKPSLTIYDLVERVKTSSAPVKNHSVDGDYVTRAEFDALVAAVGRLQSETNAKEADNE